MGQRFLFSRLVVLIGCIVSIFLLTYINYNKPIFKQAFAHYFYETTEVKKVKTGFACINVSVHRTSSFLDKNEDILLGGMIGSNKFEYKVKGKTYNGSGYSYLKNHMGCQQIIYQAAYFPLFPDWSVVDNSFPSGKYWDNFIQSTVTILSILLIYSIIWISAYFYKYQIISSIREDKKFNLLAISVFLPCAIILLLSIFPIFDMLNEISRTSKSLYRNFFHDYVEIGLGVALYLCAFLPSGVIFIKSLKGKKLKYLYAAIFMIALWWFWMIVISRLTAHSILLAWS